jgi:hypothetical protein
MVRNTEIAYINAATLGGVFLVSLAIYGYFSRRRAVPLLLGGLLALHPAWTLSAIDMDCGYLRRDASYVFTALGYTAFAWQVGRCVWTARKPVQWRTLS